MTIIIKYLSDCFKTILFETSCGSDVFAISLFSVGKKIYFDLTEDSFEFTSTSLITQTCQVILYSLFPHRLFQNCFISLYAITPFAS